MGAQGMLTHLPNFPKYETKYKRSKIVFAVTCIVLTLAPLGNKLLKLPVQSLIGSPGTLSHSIFDLLLREIVTQ